MVDKLLAWFKSLPSKFMNWWERFTARQKRTIIILAVSAIAAFGILIFIVSRPTYTTVYTAQNATEASEVIAVLEGENIAYQTSDDGLEIKIDKDDLSAANLALGTHNIYSESFGIENVTSSGFSTTESDRQKLYVVYLESQMRDSLETYSFVKNATVILDVPEDDGTLIAQNTEKGASVILELSGECTTDTAAAMARFIATGLGNSTTANITILDSDGRLLFSGSDEESSTGNASSQLALTEQVANAMKTDVKNMLIATNEFSNIEIAAKVVLDNSYSEYAEHLYWPADDQDQGVLASEDIYESQSTGGTGGVPGTDSNVETGYDYEDNSYSNSVVTEASYDYLPNESSLLQQIPAGAIKYDECSITITALTYNMIKEEDVKKQGLLDGISWDEYKLANQEKVKLPVDEELYMAVSTATGIDVDNITIIHYVEPMFIDKEGLDIEASDVLEIILIILILALLAFVILRSMKTSKEPEQEKEISIEEILKSTPAENLDEIGVEDKSEARKIVEKFVEENPEAAANLLRNWLSENWG